MQNFNELGLPESLQHTLLHMKFIRPTPIQQQAIPQALEGRDILGSAQTGTGKTGAFGIPLVVHLLSNPQSSALVATPTRELATQVMTQLQAMLGKNSKVKTALLIGGESIPKQLKQLRNKPQLFVGTPGRINDHLQRSPSMLSTADFLVLDETDRMLDMGFAVQIEKILKLIPEKRQTMLFSATIPNNIIKISEKYLSNPVRVAVNADYSPVENLKHDVVHVDVSDKHQQLLSELDARSGSVLLFMKTKYSTEKMAVKLSKAGYSADAIHGNLRQNKRERVIENFRNKKYRILVATDVAARGLDIVHVKHVINYDLPQCVEDYIHRIGRTARAGEEGSAMCFVTPSDTTQWNSINRLMNPDAAIERSNESRPSNSKSKNYRSNNYRRSNSKSNNYRSTNSKSNSRKQFSQKH